MTKNELDEKEIEEAEELPEVVDGQEDTFDYRAHALRNLGIAKRNATRLKRLKETKVEEPVVASKKAEIKEGFDYGEKAYLKSAGIRATEYGLVEKYITAGKSLDEVLDEDSTVGKLFQAELKESRDTRATKDAIPSGSKRSTSFTRDTVDYWVAKGGLPPADQRELRQQVVDARIKAEKSRNVFSDRPIV